MRLEELLAVWYELYPFIFFGLFITLIVLNYLSKKEFKANFFRKSVGELVLQDPGDAHKFTLPKDSFGNIKSKEILICLYWRPLKKMRIDSSIINYFRSSKLVDLDLGCGYELRNGKKGVVGFNDTITFNYGSYSTQPWIEHEGGISYGQFNYECISLNPAGINDLKRLTVYSCLFKGIWDEINVFISLKVPGNPDIVVEMGQQKNKEMMCALAEINFEGSAEINVKKLVTFHNGHADCDRAYNWGLQWKAGSK